MESKESCVFCNTEQSVKNMKRHVTMYCDKARAECPAGDLLHEWERRTAKRKGFGNMMLFATKTPKRSDPGTYRHDDEQLLREEGAEEVPMEVGNVEDFRDANANEEPFHNLHHAQTEHEIADPPVNVLHTEILEKLSDMNLGIKSLNERMHSFESMAKKEIPQIAKPIDVEPEDDRLYDLRKCSNVNDILGHLKELAIAEDADGGQFIFCQLCCSGDADKFGERERGTFEIPEHVSDVVGNQSQEFRSLKNIIKRHIKSANHTDQWNVWQAKEEKEQKLRSKNQVAGLRVARTAMVGYQKGRSREDFQEQILLQVTNGLEMGELNNSYSFFEKFRKYVYTEVQQMVEKFLSTRTKETGFYPPLNIQCDKGTSNHRQSCRMSNPSQIYPILA